MTHLLDIPLRSVGGWNRSSSSTTREGPAIPRALAAPVFTTLCLLLSAAPACADPTFLLAQSEARAGDTVQFSIAGANKHVTYDIEVGGKEVLEGSGSPGRMILGQFTMPDLGASSRTVTVQAEIDERRGTTVARRNLQYLLPAPSQPMVSAPLATEPLAAPVVVQQGAPPPPEPPHTIPPATAPVAPASVQKRPTRAPRHARGEPRATGRNRGPKRHIVVERRSARHGAKHGAKHRTKRRAARTAPLFDGIPESGSGPGSAAQADGPGFLSLNAIAPSTSVLTAAKADGLTAAVMVPALLGLAALALTGTALLRKRLTARGTAARARPRARVP
jgi:hypothetical protein